MLTPKFPYSLLQVVHNLEAVWTWDLKSDRIPSLLASYGVVLLKLLLFLICVVYVVGIKGLIVFAIL